MHYGSVSINGKEYSACDFIGNRALNGGYLSELDKKFISELYNKNNSSNIYKSNIPIVDRIYVQDSSRKLLDIYANELMTEIKSLLVDDIYESSYNTQITVAKKGFLELPGEDNTRNIYNSSGFKKNCIIWRSSILCECRKCI